MNSRAVYANIIRSIKDIPGKRMTEKLFTKNHIQQRPKLMQGNEKLSPGKAEKELSTSLVQSIPLEAEGSAVRISRFAGQAVCSYNNLSENWGFLFHGYHA